MTGFKLRTSGIGSNRSTNWATTTALVVHVCYYFQFDGANLKVCSVTKKIAKCLYKLPKHDFTRKMIDFDTFTKIA